MFTFDYVASLGPHCLPAMQARHVFARIECLTTPFSYQITPETSVIAYFDADFKGVFDQSDLTLTDAGIAHRRLHTVHPHEFPNGILSYHQARSRHDHLCEKMRLILRRPGTGILFLIANAPPEDCERLRSAITRFAPTLAFHILSVPSRALIEEWDRPLCEWSMALDDAKRRWRRRGLVAEAHRQTERLLTHVRRLSF